MQFKLEEIKISFDASAKTKIDEINLLDIDNEFKSELISSIERSSIEIKESSNYSILLTSKFKESYNEYLQYLDLLGELKLKTEKDLLSSTQDAKKLESILELNKKIDTKYDDSYDIAQISHRILLSKIKHNVNFGISKKVSLNKCNQDVYKKVDGLIRKGSKFITSLTNSEIIEYINTKFNLSELSLNLIPKTTEKLNERTGYTEIVNKFNTKDKVESDNTLDSKYDNTTETLKQISEIFEVDIDEVLSMLRDKSFNEKRMTLPKNKQTQIIKVFEKFDAIDFHNG